MKLKQFVIRMRKDGFGKDYGIVTDDPLDVYAKCAEIGMTDPEAQRFMEWSKHARFGASAYPLGNSLCGFDMTTAGIECRDPMRKAIVTVKTKPKRGKKGDTDVG